MSSARSVTPTGLKLADPSERQGLPRSSPSYQDMGPAYLDFAVVLPTYNEAANVPILIERLRQTLNEHGSQPGRALNWEAIFVDDNSPDGTAEVVERFAAQDCRIRVIRRMNDRGLASACIDGMLATKAAYIAVMDADLQHDETILPKMLARLRDESLDVVVGTRNAAGGSMGEFSAQRRMLSRVGKHIGDAVCNCRLSDPMSGFFMVRRAFFLGVLPHLQRSGFKILVDMLASSRGPVAVGEVGYTFGRRKHGESKLDVFVGIEYLSLVSNKLFRGFLPPRLNHFLIVGLVGVAIHLAVLSILSAEFAVQFVAAQVAATFVAMTGNFFLNNLITFRDRRLRGTALLTGMARFVLACSFAAWVNVVCARWLWQAGIPWRMAGLIGIVLGSAWNLTVSSKFTWGIASLQTETEAEGDAGETPAAAVDFEVTG